MWVTVCFGVVLPRGNVRRDFIDRCVSPLRCATDCGMVSVGAVASASPYARCTFSPVPLAGLLFGDLSPQYDAPPKRGLVSRPCGVNLLFGRVNPTSL